jgi:hypothetical protein
MTTFKKFKSAYLVITVAYRVTVRELFSQLNITYLEKKFINLKNGRPKTVRLEARVSLSLLN